MRGDPYVPPLPAIPSYDSQSFFYCRPLFVGAQPLGTGCRNRRAAGGCSGRSGSGDYKRGHGGDPGGDGDSLSLGYGFGGTVRGGPAAAGAVFGAGGGGRDVAADFAADSGGGGSDDAVDVQVEGGGADGDDHGVGSAADRIGSEFGLGAAGRAGHQRPAAEWAQVHGSVVVGAGGDAGSARVDVGIERGSFLRRDSGIQHQLSGGWRRRQ